MPVRGRGRPLRRPRAGLVPERGHRRLDQAGCNSGGCHGSPSGKGGFSLSMMGYDPLSDRRVLTRAGWSRRTNPIEPEASLLLRKATTRIAHGGGLRLRESDAPYALLRDWIAEGCRTDLDRARPWPGSRSIPSRAGSSASRSGRSNCSSWPITPTARPATSRGSPRTPRPRNRSRRSAPMDWSKARTGGRSPSASATSTRWSPGPSPSSRTCPASSGTTRRATTGSTTSSTPSSNSWATSRPGRAPTPSSSAASTSTSSACCRPSTETRAFLADTSPDKRSKLIDRLLDRPEYAAYWGQRQADLLRVTRQSLTTEGARRYYEWIVESVRSNQPFDRFVGELLTSEGDTYERPSANYYRAAADTNERHRVDRPALHGRADRLRQVPQPPVRPLDAGQLLRDRRRLRPGPPRACARPAQDGEEPKARKKGRERSPEGPMMIKVAGEGSTIQPRTQQGNEALAADGGRRPGRSRRRRPQAVRRVADEGRQPVPGEGSRSTGSGPT